MNAEEGNWRHNLDREAARRRPRSSPHALPIVAYLASHPEMADSAIHKMVVWYEAGGETEFG